MQLRRIVSGEVLHTMKKSLFHLDALLIAAVLLLPVCEAGSMPGATQTSGAAEHDTTARASQTKVPRKRDTTPHAFSFSNQTKVAPDTLIESEAVRISGINVPARLSISGGEYSIDGHAYRANPGTIKKNQKVRIRVRSAAESMGQVAATLTIGGVSGTFTVKTANLSGRVEAEAASPTGGATTVSDDAASKGKAVFIGSAGFGISTADSVDAQALILAYRTDRAGTLEASVNGACVGKFTLRPTAGEYATASVVVSVHAGDVITIASPSDTGASETYIDYVEFAASPFRAVSTLAIATDPWLTDGVSIGPDGNIYVSGGPGGTIRRVTPEGEVSVFATGFVSANGSRFDSKGNLFVADWAGNAVRKITPDGVMTTFASGLNGPAGVWIDEDDNLLVSLYGTSGPGGTVVKITPDGIVSTYASGGGLMDVVSIVGDENGNVYAGNWASGTLFNITGGNVSVLAVTGGASNHVCYSHGYIYIPSPTSALVRRVSLTGTVETFIGTSTRQVIDGPIGSADFDRPNACAISADGTTMYVMEREKGSVRKVDAGMP